MDYDISHRINAILQEKADEGIIGMGVYAGARKKRSGSKVAKKRSASKCVYKIKTKRCRLRKSGSKTAKKRRVGSKRGRGEGVYAGCEGSECSCGMGGYVQRKKATTAYGKLIQRKNREFLKAKGKKHHNYSAKTLRRMFPKKKAGSKSAKKRVGSKSAKMNPWLKHVKAWRKAHPNVSYQVALQRASKTYRR